MRSVRFRNVPILTSRLGFGTSQLHHLPREADRQALLREAWDRGVRYFDSAPLYGHGMAERSLGRFLDGRKLEATVATKFGIPPRAAFEKVPALMYVEKGLTKTGFLRRAAPPRKDFSPETARVSVLRSLKRLRLERIDILYLHEPTLATLGEAEGLLEILDRLVADGSVRYFGVSSFAADCAQIAERYPPLCRVVQAEAGDEGALSSLQPDVTFGHFRLAGESKRTAREVFDKASSMNPDGVILVSTRRADRISELVREADRLAPVLTS